MELETQDFAGPVRKTARVYTNDPTGGTIKITVLADIKAVFRSDPSDMIFILTTKGKPASETITLTNALEEPVEIVGLEHDFEDAKDLDIKLEPMEKSAYSLTVSTKALQEYSKYGSIKLLLKGGPVKSYGIRADVIVESE